MYNGKEVMRQKSPTNGFIIFAETAAWCWGSNNAIWWDLEENCQRMALYVLCRFIMIYLFITTPNLLSCVRNKTVLCSTSGDHRANYGATYSNQIHRSESDNFIKPSYSADSLYISQYSSNLTTDNSNLPSHNAIGSVNGTLSRTYCKCSKSEEEAFLWSKLKTTIHLESSCLWVI